MEEGEEELEFELEEPQEEEEFEGFVYVDHQQKANRDVSAEKEALQKISDEFPFVLKPEKLNITWETDENYWKKENEYAYLLDVCWFDITGNFDNLPIGNYEVILYGNFVKGCNPFELFTDVREGDKTIASFKNTSNQLSDLPFTALTIGEFEWTNDGTASVRIHNTDDPSWKSGLSVFGLELRNKYARRFQHTKRAE